MAKLRSFIVNSLEFLATIGFVLFVLGAAITGGQGGGFIGFIGGAIVGFFGGVITFGILFTLIEINQNIKKLVESQGK